jgi:hypothetical protein
MGLVVVKILTDWVTSWEATGALWGAVAGRAAIATVGAEMVAVSTAAGRAAVATVAGELQ